VATPFDQRTTIVRTGAVHVELLHCPLDRGVVESYTAERQVLFPLGGAFDWHVGRTTMHVDANQIVFLERDQVSRDSYPVPTVVTCLVMTLPAATAELLGHPVRLRTALASSPLLARAAWYAAVARGRGAIAEGRRGLIDPLMWEEQALELLGMATACARRATGDLSSSAAARLAARAKRLLGDRERPLGLTAIAAKLGVSPTYLTDAFRRAEGIPLVRYQLRLRLIRALRELPHAGDLTRLALDLGFASHSHFSTAFRAAIGLTPSQYRERARGGIQLPG
jgi:AraC-like DNA-binding protein